MELIDKSALAAEIKRRKQTWQHQDQQYSNGGKDVCDYLLGFIDTLEVKEVDLEKELDEWMRYGPHTSYPWCTIPDAIKITAEYFFELGLKQKGE